MVKTFLGGMVLLFVAISFWPSSGPGPRPALVAAPVVAQAKSKPVRADAGNGYASVRLARAADGHFYADAMVNGAPVRFMVDTGASSIALSAEDARRVGLAFSAGEFTGQAQTASGTVGIKPVALDRVTIGPLEATQVDAAIVEQGLGISLLGQSWLRRVGTVTINGDVMELR